MSEKSFFVKVFGDYPIIKLLDFLITFREFDYPLTEIANNSRVGWSTLHSFWPKLVKSGIVTKTRQIGRATLYKLNLENPIVQELITLDEKITAQFTKKIVAEELREVKAVKEPTPVGI